MFEVALPGIESTLRERERERERELWAGLITDRVEAQVHGCNKLASRHMRLELAESRAVPHCDICENAPGTFVFCLTLGTTDSNPCM